MELRKNKTVTVVRVCKPKLKKQSVKPNEKTMKIRALIEEFETYREKIREGRKAVDVMFAKCGNSVDYYRFATTVRKNQERLKDIMHKKSMEIESLKKN